jgi:hypothetical protein
VDKALISGLSFEEILIDFEELNLTVFEYSKFNGFLKFKI